MLAAVPGVSGASEVAAEAPGPIVVELDDPTLDPTDPAIIEAARAELDELAAADRIPSANLQEAVAGDNAPLAFATNGIQVEYINGSGSTTPPADVRAAVEAAVEVWNDALTINGPLVVEFGWKPLQSGILGIGGPTTVHRPSTGQSDQLLSNASAWYPAALANSLFGTDHNDDQAEISITLDSGRYPTGGWYVGTSASPPSGSRDLMSTVVHEIGHGLGFLGSPSTTTANPGGTFTGKNKLVYDYLVEYRGTQLLSLANPDNRLRSGELTIDLGGDRDFSLYDPSTFINGSSFSHFAESYGPGQAGALMTPVLTSGETTRHVDGATLAVLQQIGWTVTSDVAPARLTGIVGSNRTLEITWTADFASVSDLPPTSYLVEVLQNGTVVSSETVDATTTSTVVDGLTNFTDYQVQVTAKRTIGVDQTSTATMSSLTVEGQPTDFSVTGTSTTRKLSWTSPTGPGSDGASYEAQRRVIGTTTWTKLGTTQGSSFTDSAIPTGNYQYRLVIRKGSSSDSSTRSTIIGVSGGPVRDMALDGQIARLYEATLGRAPEASGMTFWLNERASGRSLANIASEFAASTEFTTSYGSLSNAAFVDHVYRNVLGRGADTGGAAFWLERLNNGATRGDMMVGFSESEEYVAQTGTAATQSSLEGQVFRLYFAYFLREPDTGGGQYWLSELESGRTLASISTAMAGAPEFAASYGQLDDGEFVDLVYRNVLGRAAEPAGRAAWVAELEAGASRGEVMIGFSDSSEFILRTGTTP